MHQPGKEPLRHWTVGQLVFKSSEKWNDREALVSTHQNQRFTFHEVKEHVTKLAAGFLNIGLKPGDAIGIWGSNTWEWYMTSLAANMAGLVVVNINPAYQVPEVEYCLKKLGVSCLVMDKTFKSQNYPQMVQQFVPELAASKPGCINSKNLPQLKSVIIFSEEYIPGCFRYCDISVPENMNEIEFLQNKIQPDDACNVQFTSGTTGKPKGTVLSHHIIVNNSFFTGNRIGLHKRHHRLCLNVPFFHCFGNVCGILCALHFGCTVVLPSGSFKADDSIKAIAKEKCTIFYGTPTMHNDMISAKEKLQIETASVETVVTGGAICSPELFKKMHKTFGPQRVVSYYGMTETGPISFVPFFDDDTEKTFNTVGAVLDHLEVKVVDTSGKIVPMGTRGELCVRGYSTMLAYWGEKDATDRTIDSDGWLKTGDQIILHENGYGIIVGRIKDMIIRGGENIFPKEIEEHLEKHPFILEAQVFGVADERLGEIVCAAIRTSDNLNKHDVTNFCKGKIAHFKIPHYIQFVKEYPKTTSGKIQKFKLKEALEKELKLS